MGTGISTELCCCGKQNLIGNQNFDYPTENKNLITIDYFFQFIPQNIIKKMNENKFENNNNAEIRTERVMNDDNSTLDAENKIIEILYHGEFDELGKKNGVGKMIIIKDKEKIFYQGIWENDYLNNGNVYYEDGSFYIGEIKNYMRHGKGKFQSELENYDGDWKEDQKDGEGTLIFSDGTKYTGTFKHNKFNGKGIMEWKDGFFYDGYFLNNFLHGEGYLRGNNEHIYKGHFQNGKFHGEGTFKWINRNEYTEYYKGNYSSGQKDGKGEFHFRNGHVYNGLWKSGEPDGEGIYETNNRKYYGNWRSGTFLQLIEVEEKEKAQEENLNLTFKVPIEDIYVTEHISTSLNTEMSVKSSNVNFSITYLK